MKRKGGALPTPVLPSAKLPTKVPTIVWVFMVQITLLVIGAMRDHLVWFQQEMITSGAVQVCSRDLYMSVGEKRERRWYACAERPQSMTEEDSESLERTCEA
jgi:hypothetical protein